jgi:hypothetical protein
MIFGLPRSTRCLQRLSLSIQFDFALSQLYQESGAFPVAYDLVYFAIRSGG